MSKKSAFSVLTLNLTLAMTLNLAVSAPKVWARNGSHGATESAMEAVGSSTSTTAWGGLCAQPLANDFAKQYAKSIQRNDLEKARSAFAEWLEKAKLLPKPGFFGGELHRKNQGLVQINSQRGEDVFRFRQSNGATLTLVARRGPSPSLESLTLVSESGKKQDICSPQLKAASEKVSASPSSNKTAPPRKNSARLVSYIQGKTSCSVGGTRWSPERYRMAARVADLHPELTRSNYFGSLCTNYMDLDVEARKAVLAKTIMALAWAESNFKKDDEGDEGKGPTFSEGELQLSEDVKKNYGCRGRLKTVNADSIDCAFRIFKAKGVSSATTFWSVLRPHTVVKWEKPDRITYHGKGRRKKRVVIDGGSKDIVHPMERRFMPTFLQYVSECRTRIPAEMGYGDSKPPPPACYVGEEFF